MSSNDTVFWKVVVYISSNNEWDILNGTVWKDHIICKQDRELNHIANIGNTSSYYTYG